MSVRDLQSYGLTAVSLVAGVVASLKTGDWTWFSRSGAAIVAIGIVLTSHQIFEHNRRLQEHQRKGQSADRSGNNRVYGHDWADENSIRELIRSRVKEEDRWKSEFNGFYMLVGGTLIWGFGDLISNIFR